MLKFYCYFIFDVCFIKVCIFFEVKVFDCCYCEGVLVLVVFVKDVVVGWMMIEWIEGELVRVGINKWLGEWLEDDVVVDYS